MRSTLLFVLRCALAAPALAAVTSCASSSTTSSVDLGRTTTTAGSVVYNGGGLSLGLVSETLLVDLGVPGNGPDERKAAFYSEERDNAQVKVAPDDAIAGLADVFRDDGFFEQASEGQWNGTGKSALTLTVDGQSHTMVQPEGPDVTPERLTAYIDLAQKFQQVYNAVRGYQNLSGVPTFEEPVLSDRLRAKIDSEIGLGGAR